MSNLLQSSQTQATTAPSYYTDYLSNIASQGANAAQNAQYVGAQPLQQQAFENVGTAASAYQPTLQQAGQTLTSAGGVTSPLAAGANYLAAAGQSPAQQAQGYMSPYINSVINNMSDIAQRNIQQNLAPQATSSAVGSGQFGSQRGAQVLGQVINSANQDLNNQIGQLLNSGYNTALTTAEQQNALQGQLGQIAGNQASANQQNLTNLGAQQSTLAGQNQALGLADINALSTLGGQQQTIAQNQQLFPLTNLSTLSGLLRGYNVPTTTTTTAQGSPLSGAATLGAGLAGLLQGTGTSGTGPNLLSQLTGQSSIGGLFNNIFGTGSTSSGGTAVNGNPNGSANIDTSGWKSNGDGTYTTTTGQIVDAYGNPQD